MGSVSVLCQTMLKWCSEMDMHYGQGNSSFPLPRYNFTYGGSTDCSAMGAFAAIQAGYDVPPWLSSWTFEEYFVKAGWRSVPATGHEPDGAAFLVATRHHVGLWDGEKCIEFGGDPHFGYVPVHGWYNYRIPGEQEGWDIYLYPPEEPDTEESENEMVCIFQPNDMGALVYYDGAECHLLHHEDEAEAIRMVYRNCNGGREIPQFKLGSDKAPWASRFMDATRHGMPSYQHLIDKPGDK